MDDPQSLTLFSETKKEQITGTEILKLQVLEVTIERGVKAFVEVGLALLAIRDQRLYRAKYGTFEGYCQERWGFVASRARQLIAAAETVNNLKSVTTGNTLTERQIRPLVGLEPERQREIYAEAIDTAPNGKITAAHVQRVVDDYEEQAEQLAESENGYDWSDEKPEPEPHVFVKPPMPEQKWKPAPDIASESGPNKLAVHFSGDTPEHYTPAEIIEAVLECLGTIDLDPCSNSHETPNIPATTHYTIDDDGLSREWNGKVYMNPPYGREIGKWVDKLCSEYEAERVEEAIALVPARTDTDWFDQLIDGFKFHCFVHGRLVFIGNTESAPFPSAVVYLGTDWGKFYYSFRHFGRIVQETNPEMFGA